MNPLTFHFSSPRIIKDLLHSPESDELFSFMKSGNIVLWIILVLFLFSIQSNAQDTIFKLNGEKIAAKILEVTPDLIKYNRFNFAEGPVYTMYLKDITKIKYTDGYVDNFNPDAIITSASDKVNYDTLVDDRDGQKYKVVLIGKRWWMAENLRFKSPECTCNNIDMKNCERCGYQYNFNEAHLVCPEGWHLPSDNEWMELENAVGMSFGEVKKTGWRGTGAGQAYDLLSEGSSGFNIIFCGRSNESNSARSPDEAFFWTSSMQNYSTNPYTYSWVRHFKLRASIDRDAFLSTEKLNVRCMKD